FGLELLLLRARGEIADLARDGHDALAIGVADDRRDEPVRNRDGDRNVDAPVNEDRLRCEGGVRFGYAKQSDGARFDEKIIEADLLRRRALGCTACELGVDLLAK